ncbi:kinase-like domain-containing protein [Chiua virens]|nr:kinase-like domain-containing protein [Chiua virens]
MAMPVEGPDFCGQQVGPYLLTSVLGIGAAGSVYQAVDHTLKMSPLYAIKCVRKSRVIQQRRQQRAEMENHDAVVLCPNIMSLYECFEEDKHFFLVMPLVETDMFKAIWKWKAYWKNDALIKQVFVDIIDGIFACHRKGIYHRDLKPENIMCDADGTRIRISDFGLSTNRRICRDGGCGTASYMAPECWDERDVFYYADAADIWSLGVILFNMVTCQYPWEVACRTDEKYAAFVSDRGYLLHTLPVSEPLSELLYRIWNPVPMRRMSIPAIREAVLEMETFYSYIPRRSSNAPSEPQLLNLVDSEKTCVNEMPEDGKKKIFDALIEESLVEVPLCSSS